jgi:hypothetical protein
MTVWTVVGVVVVVVVVVVVRRFPKLLGRCWIWRVWLQWHVRGTKKWGRGREKVVMVWWFVGRHVRVMWVV